MRLQKEEAMERRETVVRLETCQWFHTAGNNLVEREELMTWEGEGRLAGVEFMSRREKEGAQKGQYCLWRGARVVYPQEQEGRQSIWKGELMWAWEFVEVLLLLL